MPKWWDRLVGNVKNDKTPRPKISIGGDELSWTDPDNYMTQLMSPQNPDALVSKKGLKIFDTMRIDDQVHAALRIKKMAVMGPGWEVLPADESAGAKEAAYFVKYCLNDVDGSFEYDLEEVLTALDYGYSVSELVWKKRDDGRIGLKTIKTRKPHNFDFKTDPHGNILPNGLIQEVQGKELTYPTDRFIIYTHQPEFDNKYGRSDLVGAHRAWWVKDNLWKMWAILLERHAEPLVDVSYTEDATPAEISALEDVVKNLSARKYAIHGDVFTVDLKVSDLRGANAFEAAIQNANLAITRSLLIPKHLGISESGEIGTLAQAKQNFELFLMIVRGIRQDVERRVMADRVVRELVDFNFSKGTPYPVWRFKPITNEEALDLFTLWKELVGAGAVEASDSDEEYIRSIMQMPPKGEPLNLKPPSPGGAPGRDKAIFSGEQKPHIHAVDRTPFERRFRFHEVRKRLDEMEAESMEILLPILTGWKEELTRRVERLERGGYSAKGINEISLPQTRIEEFRKAVKEMMNSSFMGGRKHASSVMGLKKLQVSPELLTPEEAMRAFEGRAFWITGIVEDDVLNETKGVLHNAMLTGETLPVTRLKLARVLASLAETPEIQGSDKKFASRLETIIRTNTMTAYNGGLLAEYREAARDGIVEAVQFSAVMDDRTTEVCRGAHGTILPIGHPDLNAITPPLHHQCRSILTPVMVGDKWSPSDQKDINETIRLMGDFKG